MRRHFAKISLLITLTLVLSACTTPGGATARTPASNGDEASDRLHDRKVHNFLEHVDTKMAR